MPSIVVDSGPLIAVFDRGDAHHGTALRFFETCRADLITNLAVIVEVTHLLSFSRQATHDFLGWVTALTIDLGTVDDLPRITAIMEKYADLPADFADASLVALCERRAIADIATIDADFTVYCLKGRRKFVNVFADVR